ncbi:hypothetical protein IC582_007224 [Cucumis melo]
MSPTGNWWSSRRPENSGKMLLNVGKPVGVLNRTICRLVRNVSNAGQTSIMAPSMSFHNVAMEVSQCSRYLREETGPVGTGHFNCRMFAGVISIQKFVNIASGFGRVIRSFGCSNGLHVDGKQQNQVDVKKKKKYKETKRRVDVLRACWIELMTFWSVSLWLFSSFT